jgi:hypothetical protein
MAYYLMCQFSSSSDWLPPDVWVVASDWGSVELVADDLLKPANRCKVIQSIRKLALAEVDNKSSDKPKPQIMYLTILVTNGDGR